MDITFSYAKRRCDYGRQPMFCEHGPEMCDSITPNPLEYKHYILRNPVHEAVQNTPCFYEHTINTIRAEYTTTGCNHAEGGWPKDVNVADIEATQRYRRKIEKDDAYINCVFTTSREMEHYILQNNAIDLYQTYYGEMSVQPPLERNSMRTVNVYHDPMNQRPVSSINWQPEGGHHFAVSYADINANYTPQGSINAFIWDIENANQPMLALIPPCPLLDLVYNPRDATMLIGGLASGQVVVFDERHGLEPTQICPPHVSHRDLCRKVLFINSKSGMEFFSGGPDGVCRWWDVRNMSEPIEIMIIDVVKYSFDVQTMPKAFGISVLEYEHTIPSRFMVGTYNGRIVGGNRKGKTALEKLPAVFETAQLGPVWALERNPYFLKNFLTVGDWRLQVWSEDCRDSPIIWSPPQRHKVTDATWSPTRCSLLFSTGWNGVVSAWDLLRRQHVPVLTMQVCAEPLLRVKVHEQGALVALGSRTGNIYMTEVAQCMTQSGKNDKSLMLAIFEREGKREKILEARLREIRLKQRQAEEGGGSPRRSLGEPDPTIGDRDLIEATQEYNALIKRELAAM